MCLWGFANKRKCSFNEANTAFAGTGTHTSLDNVNPADDTNFGTGNTGTGLATATGESDISAEMGFSIEKVTVTAKTRQLKASYSIELAQDLKAVHGLDEKYRHVLLPHQPLILLDFFSKLRHTGYA